jgi:hypothetical protein
VQGGWGGFRKGVGRHSTDIRAAGEDQGDSAERKQAHGCQI